MTFQLLRNLSFVLSAALLLSHLVEGQTCSETSPAVIKGNQIFNSETGEHLPIKGIAYRPRPNTKVLNAEGIDYFVDEFKHIWSRDIPKLQELGVNAVRLYNVNPNLNHDEFMCALDEAGIYALVGLGNECEGCEITDEDAPNCYPAALKARGQRVISEFSKYTNVLGFSAGNQANLAAIGEPERNGVCQKKFIRDMRSYVQSCGDNDGNDGMRKIPIGVVSADVDRADNAEFYGCRSDPDDEFENAEFYGINVYLHCNGGVTDTSDLGAYMNLKEGFDSYGLNVPVMLTELGCLHESFEEVDGYEAQRNFLQLEALYSEEYVETFAGGFVFEYSTELERSQETSPWPFDTYGPSNFGVGYLEPEECDDVVLMCNYTPFPQFETLSERFADVDTSFVPNIEEFEPSVTEFPDCPNRFPPLSDFNWFVDTVNDIQCPVMGMESAKPSLAPSSSPSVAPTAVPSSSPTITAAPSDVSVLGTGTSNDGEEDDGTGASDDEDNNASAGSTKDSSGGRRSKVWRNLLIAAGVFMCLIGCWCLYSCCCGGGCIGGKYASGRDDAEVDED
uniref:Asl1-like glycosyl hydrolase catalytic domain-containing protein n=1 Tax=Grammatophora oceanica TaxID=210454 RepID=A0A7S1Y2V1_9STRA|mmetsp:Transcript_14071/g.20598  ORF Transcript_14071/g.20598 Transcript_14071/m.20598 type:complete len:563 (+) Transcript_14071:42-1730(+)|eukprot:CAMPEP_0194027808 /NCGR_PEP_ID=MMETSP0009_2-20130614/1865_1 /TAXON_ID=210454 /ORGANISM="Grammatophora oceanica, Strain CCMP 410" /LENGTH=562 /DNA_ID=CAMNT_0038666981 /DNA_START=42 /DNA_END=1730 /DNA_ORIENTATION=-